MASLKRVALTDEETGKKVTLEDMLEKYSEKQHQKFEKLMDDKLDAMLDAKISKALEPITKRLENLEKTASRRSNSAPPCAFVPSYLEATGFVDSFEEAATEGVTREKAEAFVTILRNAIPDKHRDAIGEIELRAERNFAIKVPISENIREIFSLIKKCLVEKKFEERELFATLEKSSEDKKKYENKVNQMLEKEVSTNLRNHTVRIFWGVT